MFSSTFESRSQVLNWTPQTGHNDAIKEINVLTLKFESNFHVHDRTLPTIDRPVPVPYFWWTLQTESESKSKYREIGIHPVARVLAMARHKNR